MLEGKTALVFGVANRRSIAWAIAQALAGAGARMAFTYQGERIEAGVRELASSVNSDLVLPCDVTKDEDLDAVFQAVDKEFDGLDILVHSVAYAAKEDLEGRFVDTKRSNFLMALDISAYSLTAMVQRAEPLMEKRGGGAVLTMTYLGGERAVGNYNVMGVAKSALDSSLRYLAAELGPKNIRVNAISAGPIRTLAARSIAGFTIMEEHYEKRAPLRRNVDASEVGQTALFLCSPMASGITGEVVFVDAGYQIIGL
jgi:enoyl-[acyl-carrier protein] reductase I